jgi:RHS repeat-associated protein
MTFDVSDRLKTVASDTYAYSPANQRQWKNNDLTFWGAGGERLVSAQVTVIGSDLRFTQLAFDSYSHGRRLQITDRLGSVGNYYPYGEAKSGTVSNADSFATYYRDSTALDYAQQRFYQPGSARILTTDPLQASASVRVPGSWNRYMYAIDDPVNRLDPQGLEPTHDWPCNRKDPTCVPGIGFGRDVSLGFLRVWSQIQDERERSANSYGALLAREEWRRTHNALNSIANSIAQSVLSPDGINKCWENALQRLLNLGAPFANEVRDFGHAMVTDALQNVMFASGTFDVSPHLFPEVILEFAKPETYAYSYRYTNRVFWLPGELRPEDPGWLEGAVLHEVLHNIGFSDAALQTAFYGVSGGSTDNISTFLRDNWFK